MLLCWIDEPFSWEIRDQGYLVCLDIAEHENKAGTSGMYRIVPIATLPDRYQGALLLPPREGDVPEEFHSKRGYTWEEVCLGVWRQEYS